jgi:hypothetical protein
MAPIAIGVPLYVKNGYSCFYFGRHCATFCVFNSSRLKKLSAMAGKRIDPMDLRQLIPLKKQGISNRKVAQLLQISRNTVNRYTSIFEHSGRSYSQLLDLDELAFNRK